MWTYFSKVDTMSLITMLTVIEDMTAEAPAWSLILAYLVGFSILSKVIVCEAHIFNCELLPSSGPPGVAGEAPGGGAGLPAESLHAGLRRPAPGLPRPPALRRLPAQEQGAPYAGRRVLERHLRQVVQPHLPR